MKAVGNINVGKNLDLQSKHDEYFKRIEQPTRKSSKRFDISFMLARWIQEN